MTDTGWTFEGFRVIESENAPDPNRIKHLGAVSSGHSPFLSRIINTCDLHGAILDVSDPVQNMRAAYDYHTRRSVYNSKERTMTTNHIDQLAQWWEGAEEGPARKGDIVIEYTDDDPTCFAVFKVYGDDLEAYTYRRILARAPKPKPAWHDAIAVTATATDDLGDEITAVWVREGDELWRSDEGGMVLREDLRDVTPLIEAKVTDEMRDRVRDYYRIEHQVELPRDDVWLNELLTAALGLETA